MEMTLAILLLSDDKSNRHCARSGKSSGPSYNSRREEMNCV
jgi:hypothetical protein